MSVTVQLHGFNGDMFDKISIAKPCRADWNAMTGNEQTRFCQSCQKNVYNIAMMSRAEAITLIAEKEGQMCVRLSRRADGTLITNDCPVGQETQTRRRRRGWTIAAIVAVLIPSPVSAWMKRASATTLRTVPALSALEQTTAGQKVFGYLDPEPEQISVMAGAMMYTPPPAPTKK